MGLTMDFFYAEHLIKSFCTRERDNQSTVVSNTQPAVPQGCHMRLETAVLSLKIIPRPVSEETAPLFLDSFHSFQPPLFLDSFLSTCTANAAPVIAGFFNRRS